MLMNVGLRQLHNYRNKRTTAVAAPVRCSWQDYTFIVFALFYIALSVYANYYCLFVVGALLFQCTVIMKLLLLLQYNNKVTTTNTIDRSLVASARAVKIS